MEACVQIHTFKLVVVCGNSGGEEGTVKRVARAALREAAFIHSVRGGEVASGLAIVLAVPMIAFYQRLARQWLIAIDFHTYAAAEGAAVRSCNAIRQFLLSA
jgi:hypothetical protein